MRYGLIGSIILHIVIFGLVIFNFASREADAPPPAVQVPVEIMAPKEVSERQAGKVEGKAEKPAPPAEVKAAEAPASVKKEALQKPSPKPAKKEALVAPPPAKAEPPAGKPVEKPAPKHAARKEPAPKPAAAPKHEPVRRAAEPEAKHAEARPDYKFDPSRIEANLHKDQARASQPMTSQSNMEARPSKIYSDRQTAVLNRDPNAGALPSGDYDPSRPWRPASSLQDQAMGLPQARGGMNAGSCAEAVQSRIEQNWILPIGAVSAENTIIRLRIELNRDGTLLRPPAVLDQSPSPAYQAMADAAVRAALSGQPYSIPPPQYEQCRDMILRFNPRDMYGG